MWERGWRDQIWDTLDQEWDLVVIGGGVTGAGVLREAVNRGLKTLLVEAADFSFGTSSRSSKLVHGGFRYLRNRQFDITRESVREREWLLKAAPRLVDQMAFLLPAYAGSRTPAWQYSLGVLIYDLMAPKWDHRALSARRMLERVNGLRADRLTGGHLYHDALVDDARLVLRLLEEAVRAGGAALNYARVEGLLRGADGQVRGVALADAAGSRRAADVKARAVINAAGPWADQLRAALGAQPGLRKCRGSHLVFPAEKFPLDCAVTLMHPRDNRAMFAIPWEGTTIIGTTDLDHPPEWERGEPFAAPAEVDYILEALAHTFPGVEAGQADILSSFAGLRPLVCPQAGEAPSAVSRRHVLWDDSGLVTITGGKLTIFRIMARDALDALAGRLPARPAADPGRFFDPLPMLDAVPGLDPAGLLYLAGRYGAQTAGLLAAAEPGELQAVEGLPNRWAELRWAARCGAVEHLDDLLLRRVRLGLLLPRGGLDQVARIRAIVQPELGWDDARWAAEEQAYRDTWRRYYAPHPAGPA